MIGPGGKAVYLSCIERIGEGDNAVRVCEGKGRVAAVTRVCTDLPHLHLVPAPGCRRAAAQLPHIP